MPPLGAYALVAAIAALGTYLAMFPVRRLAERIGFVAEPDERRVHQRVTPYGGGVAMFVAFLVAMIVASQLPGLQGVFQGSSEPLGLVLGAAVIFAVGLIDDFRDMSAPAKMAGQVLAATVLVYFGLTMFQFKIPTVGFVVLGPDVLPLLTALWVIVITNAVNLIDGLDGLAAGIVAIASGALAVYSLRLVDLGVLPADNLGPLIAVIAFGVCVGFLPHNFHPARAFMGDAGALFVGLLMAAATMVIGGRTPEVSGQTYFFFAPLFLPIVILGVPIADMAFAVVRRTARGTGFHTPDKDHVHHRLMRLGHGHRRTVLILWAWTAVLSAFVLVPLFGGRGNGIIPLGAVALGLALYTLFHPGLRKDTASDAPEAPGPTPGASVPADHATAVEVGAGAPVAGAPLRTHAGPPDALPAAPDGRAPDANGEAPRPDASVPAPTPVAAGDPGGEAS
ncbi:MAG TPA: undecaprenyl/decaprenyl-phosphate alpha-N-acetylglucosaminyl 1-phosphate transferase [Acidimicrobiales bacterium]|nr:undecaprenyl/decaprenyl-phosphate alpha-N-acetylglucosaminyl 1-phosphate transferase [Acidimicrobiales bacterium]